MTQDEVIDDFIKRYKDSTGKELKKESFEIVNTIKKPWAKNTSWVKVFVSERGDVKFMISPGKGNNSLRYYHQKFSTREFEKHLGGVYSTTRSSQKMNEDKAVNYLVEKLGIDKSNVIVTNAIMKSVADEEIFGMVDLCHDSLLGGLTGYITLSRHGGMGVTYHEAWHYVNLLLHDKDTRLAIYTDYLKHHKELKRKGVKVREVEEHLAEEFRKYVEERDDTSLRGRVKLMFHNIIDFINALLNRKQYRKFFKDIQSGKYGKQK